MLSFVASSAAARGWTRVPAIIEDLQEANEPARRPRFGAPGGTPYFIGVPVEPKNFVETEG